MPNIKFYSVDWQFLELISALNNPMLYVANPDKFPAHVDHRDENAPRLPLYPTDANNKAGSPLEIICRLRFSILAHYH